MIMDAYDQAMVDMVKQTGRRVFVRMIQSTTHKDDFFTELSSYYSVQNDPAKIPTCWRQSLALMYYKQITSGFERIIPLTSRSWDHTRFEWRQIIDVYEPSLFVKGCFFENRANAQAFGTILEALRAWNRFCFVSEVVSSSHSTEPYITGRGSSRLQSTSRHFTI